MKEDKPNLLQRTYQETRQENEELKELISKLKIDIKTTISIAKSLEEDSVPLVFMEQLLDKIERR